jgi:DNA replication protein DnaC
MSFELSGTDELEFNKFKNDLIKKYNKQSEDDLFEDTNCTKELRIEYRRIEANIPLKFRKTSFADVNDNVILKTATDEVKDYIENIERRKDNGIALYLWSKQTGTAKTLLGCEVLSAAIRKGYSAYFTEVNSCIEKLTAGWYNDGEKSDFKRYILDVDFLLIDDLGSEIKTDKSSDFVNAGLHQILRERANNLRPTFFTSNLTRDEIFSVYGNRIDSIMYESVRLVHCPGLDFRKNAQSPNINIK